METEDSKTDFLQFKGGFPSQSGDAKVLCMVPPPLAKDAAPWWFLIALLIAVSWLILSVISFRESTWVDWYFCWIMSGILGSYFGATIQSL